MTLIFRRVHAPRARLELVALWLVLPICIIASGLSNWQEGVLVGKPWRVLREDVASELHLLVVGRSC